MIQLDKKYWNKRWEEQDTAWDIGAESPAICNYAIKKIPKTSRILIPGCGNAYEADFLVKNGFVDITLIDIAPKLIESIKQKFKNYPQVKVLCEDFFHHKGTYDYIVEQTFFCAIAPEKRSEYVKKTSELLSKQGHLIGLLFDKNFEKNYPPFGGTKEEYQKIFSEKYEIHKLETCKNSIKPRQGTELFMHFIKK